MILVDTTILAYATGSDHPLRQPCRGLLGAVGDGRVRASTTVEVIQEFAHVRARRRSRREAASVASDYANGLAPLLRPTLDDVLEGLRLFTDLPGLGAFDAVLAAAARGKQMSLASADRAFSAVEDLRYLDPASESFLIEAHAVGE